MNVVLASIININKGLDPKLISLKMMLIRRLVFRNSVSISSSQYYSLLHKVNFEMVRRHAIFIVGNFEIMNTNGKTMFTVKQGLLLDPAGNPIYTLRKKFMSFSDRWQVFRGDSKESKDILFSVKRSSGFHFKTKLDVFLANNTRENVPADFKIKGSSSQRYFDYVIYAGNSSTIIAHMYKKKIAVFFGQDNFIVTVYPGVDYAFIVALILIAIEIDNSD